MDELIQKWKHHLMVVLVVALCGVWFEVGRACAGR